MMLVADAANGVARYGHLFSRAAGTRAGTVVFKAADAASAKGMAATYAKFNDALLSEPGGDFLFGFTATDLCDRQARIAIAEVVTPTGYTQFVGAVHVACDDTGTPWIRGLGVSGAFRRQNLARALVTVAMADRLRRMGSAETWRAAVIVKDGEPNRNSVRALAPLGFKLTSEGGTTPLRQDARDRHLIANVVASPDGPAIRYAKLRLPGRQAGLALSFWTGWGT